MITGVRHTGLVVQDIDTSISFYTKMMGFKIWKRAVESGEFISQLVGIPGVVLEWVKLKAPDGSLLELLQYHSHPAAQLLEYCSANQLGCSHAAITVNDANEMYQRLTANGLTCKSPPLLSPDGTVKVFYCHDPDGIILELVEDLPKSCVE
jgi:catechol 2,3-dioxygenase-like lactoylglutathione lyase family enzyme